MNPARSDNAIVGASGAARRGAVADRGNPCFHHSPNPQIPGTCVGCDLAEIEHETAYGQMAAVFPALCEKYEAAIIETGLARAHLEGQRRQCGHGEHDEEPLKPGFGIPLRVGKGPLTDTEEDFLALAQRAILEPSRHQSRFKAFLQREYFGPRPEYRADCADCACALELRELAEVEVMFDLLVEVTILYMRELLQQNEASDLEVDGFNDTVAAWQHRWDSAFVESGGAG